MTAPLRFPPFVLLPLAIVGCGPSDLTDNIENPGPIAGTFPVSRYFSPSGIMGDGEDPGFVEVNIGENCKARAANALGLCYRFDYLPGEQRWAGTFWQFPANNWGSRPGRAIDASFSKMRFLAAGEYSILMPPGAGAGEACRSSSPCRPGLACDSGACVAAATSEAGEHCIVSRECADGLQCHRQVCVEAGAGTEGAGCGIGDTSQCARGFLCGVDDGRYQCLAEGAGDVGNTCSAKQDCLAGLYCRRGRCAPDTVLGPFSFQVGGIAGTRPDLVFKDDINLVYFALGDDPQPLLTPEWQRFEIDLSTSNFSSLIGAFAWASAFPDIDSTAETGAEPYLADPSQPAFIYLDDMVFEVSE